MDMPQPSVGDTETNGLPSDPHKAESPATSPDGATAAALVEAVSKRPDGLIHLAGDERTAERIAALARAFDPHLEVMLFPPWDCLPYDRASPSPAAMGGRMATLLALARPGGAGRLLVTSPEALIQRTVTPEALQGLEHAVVLDRAGEVEAIVAFARRAGYRLQDEVGEPGDICLRGEVADIFPPDADAPVRLEIADGRVHALSAFDPLTQLTTSTLAALTLRPASELIEPQTDADPDVFPSAGPRPLGVEHDLPRLSGPLATLFDHAPAFALSATDEAGPRMTVLVEQVVAAFETAGVLGRTASPPPRPEALYLDAGGVQALISGRESIALEAAGRPTPAFALSAHPLRDLSSYVGQRVEAGGVVVLAGAAADVRRLSSDLERRDGLACEPVTDWPAVRASNGAALLALDAELERGFETADGRICVIAAQDVLGTRAHHAGRSTAATLLQADPDLRFGDVVIHEDHGVGVLRALDTVEADGVARATARLEYRDGAALLVPAEELHKLWRYGAEADVVALDRLNTGGWAKRRTEVEASIAETARELVALARTRDGVQARRISPPRQAYERFVARFPYPVTEDQASAVEAILDDLRAGRPMNRLVCGDVGFGKTEVALRAAAAVALSGRQVAVAAPTTVLARQHFQTFQRRFADFGVEVGQLSRLASSADAKATKAGLASGGIGLVVGTHALGAKDVAFKYLGLLIIDEEQRFGAKLKASLHAMAPDAHVLTLTATPIPRTLQAALVGIQDISVIATPPARRRPVRTLLQPFDPATVATALRRERARGGQSFVVTPRIEDIEALRAGLADWVPELGVLVAHGDLPAAEVDEVMVRFADGQEDVLLATNIIESGLDVPRANTMLVDHPDRFGLAQLHQLRGRVGRGRAQASAYLLYDPAHPLSEAATARLETLVALDRLGAGMAISARDLDLRGAGDLVGEDQAGHLKLIGVGLYQWLLERAVRHAREEPVDERPDPELALAVAGELPADYIPEDEVRLNLYARLSRLDSPKAVRAFAHELEDRFGPLPAPAQTLLTLGRLSRLCRQLGVAKASVGPKGVALDLLEASRAASLAAKHDELEAHDARVVWKLAIPDDERLGRLEQLLDDIYEA